MDRCINILKHFAAVIILLLAAGLMCGCSASQVTDEPQTLEELHGKRLGILTGGIDDRIYHERFSDCTASYYNSLPDLIASLKSNKTDAFFSNESQVATIISENSELSYIPESAYDQELCAIFAKGSNSADALREQFNEFLNKLEEDGTLDSLVNKWKNDFNTLDIDTDGLTGENGTIAIATSGDMQPFTFIRNNKPFGFEIDLIYRFCHEYGYIPEFSVMNFASIIPAVVSGKANIGISCIAYTDERAQSVNFSRYYSLAAMLTVVRAGEVKASLLNDIAESFRKTFIVENRWQMILSGIGVTLAITLLSTLIGSALGFAIYMLCRSTSEIWFKIFDHLSWIVSSMPVVVFLMVLFYIVFGKSSINGFWVSVFAFSLIMALSVYSSLSVAVKSVDHGQIEGAYSLGLTDLMTFLRIILPQAMVQFIPNYQRHLISLIQGTSIVGYIAVEDLTKISDIIRARTYEAFFPIICSALIYLLLCRLLTILIGRIEIKSDPKHRSSESILRRYR